MRYQLIVARDRPDIYEELRNQFQQSATLQIFFDRRHPGSAGRVPDRRAAADGERLAAKGHILVRIAE